MATKLLIVHGYSDGSTSFTALGDFFVAQGLYTREHVYYLDYSSMDDDATFRDFADKLDTDHRVRLGRERVDVVCHSTGSLVVRAWLALHAERTVRRGTEDPCPVERLICFAPANFGSDLAALGQSFLGKFRTTFFNSHSRPEDFLESGKAVLQGLEPASPFQWELSSTYDLHGASTYFSPKRPEHQRCYPFVFAAGEAYTGVQAKLIAARAKPGTDGTVRIAGTSLNTRGCSLDFRDSGAKLVWWPETKFAEIPFGVHAGFNHGSIIDPTGNGFLAPDGPGTLAVAALRSVRDLASYEALTARVASAREANYDRMPPEKQDRYQQFFFRVRDDVDLQVEDYYIDFYVVDRANRPHETLTLQFDEDFETQVYRHSASPSHRVFMMNCSKLATFHADLRAADASLMLEISGVSPLPDVRYHVSSFVAYDPAAPVVPGEPNLLEPNTTTLVDVILNRTQTDNLLVIKNRDLVPVGAAQRAAAPSARLAATGRAALIDAALGVSSSDQPES